MRKLFVFLQLLALVIISKETPQNSYHASRSRNSYHGTQTDDSYHETLTQQPCGAYTPYDTVNGRNDPISYGFKGGSYWKDGSDQYVGLGSFTTYCTQQNPVPAGIRVATKPGAYITCNNQPKRDTETAFYLLKHPKLRWVRTNRRNVINLNGKLCNREENHERFCIGRVKVDGVYRLGKIQAIGNEASDWDGLWVEGEEGESHYKEGFEVLTCKA